MNADEMRTLDALKAHRRELVDPAIAAHHGRIVKTTGDGALVEFASVVDAVGCAVVIQRGMVGRNAKTAEAQRIVLRIGINVGDIIIDGDDIFGTGSTSPPVWKPLRTRGLCISRAANDQIRDKLSLAFSDLGEQTVKTSLVQSVSSASPRRTSKRCRNPRSRNPQPTSQTPISIGRRRAMSRRFTSVRRRTAYSSPIRASAAGRRWSRPETG